MNMLWAVQCFDHPGSAEKRDKLRTIHREHLDVFKDRIFFSGPLLADDSDEQIGSLFVLAVSSRAEAQAFIDPEPFNQAGVFAEVRIIRMRKGRFNAALVDGA
jgi:uncharacterized protein YciI